MPCPYRLNPLRHLGTPDHVLTSELIVLSVLSAFVIGTSTTVTGHIGRGNRPNYNKLEGNQTTLIDPPSSLSVSTGGPLTPQPDPTP
ncbi:unnamed protein product [Pleuronectes platessa]|uniref:Uncharacterized protein n=1 Tax=Pleuronectes platessa TaxID=8262 RepID=A0A9N7VVI8_PLEPL|nr:unnamed protein product [Pleuronectes platessa]